MRIYIASSWSNRHAVVLLTEVLRTDGHEVLSFVETAAEVEHSAHGGADPAAWIASEDGLTKFHYDTNAATTSDLVIYIGPSGCDAWAEVGAAWAAGVPVWGLWSKNERVGLMRRMMTNWYPCVSDLLASFRTVCAFRRQEGN